MPNPFDPDEPALSRAGGPLTLVLLIVVACLVGATVYLYMEVRSARSAMDPYVEMIQLHEEKLAQLEGSVNKTSRDVTSSVAKVKDLVDDAERQIRASAGAVEKKVLGRTQQLSKELEAAKARQDAANAAITEVGGKVQQLRQTTDTQLGSLSGKVTTVESELAATRKELQDAIKDLKTVRGDLGVQSGLIATTSGELKALRELGERNYYEFDIRKSKKASRVGPISVRLRKADRKRNKFNLELWADDKKVEKKNKTLLEPIQFYVLGSRVPYELVINKVEKNRIVGYLSTPKTKQPRRRVASSSGS